VHVAGTRQERSGEIKGMSECGSKVARQRVREPNPSSEDELCAWRSEPRQAHADSHSRKAQMITLTRTFKL